MKTLHSKRIILVLSLVALCLTFTLPVHAASNFVTTKTTVSTTKKVKKVKMKKKAKKTRTVRKVTQSTNPYMVTLNGSKVLKTVNKKTTKVTKYKKGSKIKKVKITVRTKTTYKKNPSVITNTSTSTNTSKAETEIQGIVPIRTVAQKADANILNAFEELGYQLKVDKSVSYSGYFSSSAKSITLQKADDTVYHELGHFLAFIAGNADKKEAFISIYNAEKNAYEGINKAYNTQNSSEYFAESYRDYILNPTTLKAKRPQTYASIVSAIKAVTPDQIKKVQDFYKMFGL